ncbi:MAG: VacJ family lipoprotein [Reyranella sp.]|nr:MAG: VacJ family lipoprotein [Reyranella sp.]
MDVVADRQVLARRQRQDAQPGVLGRRPEEGEKMIHGSVDISISLCLQALNCNRICGCRTTGAAPFGLFTSNCSARVQDCSSNSGGPTPLRAFGPSVSGPAGWTRVVLMVESLPGMMKRKARRSLAAMVIATTLMGGCATGDTGAAEVWDPIETPNRFLFSINRVVDIIALRPVAVIYRDWVPEPAQKSVRNLLDNLGEPVTAINEVVQGDPSRAATTMARFLVNSTIGVAGLFDVATMLGLERTKEDAGKTIGLYAGVEPENGGFYLMLPVIGPSNARDGTGLMMDYLVDPFRILTFNLAIDWTAYQAARYGMNVVDYRSRTIFALDDLEKNSVDYYAALRSAYTQNRADLIRQKREKTDTKGELERRDNLALVR